MAALLFLWVATAIHVVPMENGCLRETVADIRNSISANTRTRQDSDRIASAIAKSSIATNLTPEFLLAVAIWESDLNPFVTAHHPLPDGTIAIDTGLMGIRCIVADLQPHRRCLNVPVRGVEFRRLREIELNVQIGARMLAKLRDQAVVIWVNRRPRRCPHRDHAFFAHYNWGQQVIKTGVGRDYDERVATITQALTDITGCAAAPEIEGAVNLVGQPPRRVQLLLRALQKNKVPRGQTCLNELLERSRTPSQP
jgi:hypothetical protein